MDAQLLLGLGGVAAVITAIVGAYVTLSKRRPEVARVFIESAGELVVTQSKVLRETTEAYDAMQRRMSILEKRAEEQEATQREAASEIDRLHNELSTMHEEMAALTQSRDKAREDLDIARHEVNRLRTRVQLLEDTLRAREIPIPNGNGEPPMEGYPTPKDEQ